MIHEALKTALRAAALVALTASCASAGQEPHDRDLAIIEEIKRLESAWKSSDGPEKRDPVLLARLAALYVKASPATLHPRLSWNEPELEPLVLAVADALRPRLSPESVLALVALHRESGLRPEVNRKVLETLAGGKGTDVGPTLRLAVEAGGDPDRLDELCGVLGKRGEADREFLLKTYRGVRHGSEAQRVFEALSAMDPHPEIVAAARDRMLRPPLPSPMFARDHALSILTRAGDNDPAVLRRVLETAWPLAFDAHRAYRPLLGVCRFLAASEAPQAADFLKRHADRVRSTEKWDELSASEIWAGLAVEAALASRGRSKSLTALGRYLSCSRIVSITKPGPVGDFRTGTTDIGPDVQKQALDHLRELLEPSFESPAEAGKWLGNPRRTLVWNPERRRFVEGSR